MPVLVWKIGATLTGFFLEHSRIPNNATLANFQKAFFTIWYCIFWFSSTNSPNTGIIGYINSLLSWWVGWFTGKTKTEDSQYTACFNLASKRPFLDIYISKGTSGNTTWWRHITGPSSNVHWWTLANQIMEANRFSYNSKYWVCISIKR